jgi:hypothetical protein
MPQNLSASKHKNSSNLLRQCQQALASANDTFLIVGMFQRKNKARSESWLLKQRYELYGFQHPPASDRMIKLEFELKRLYLFELALEAHERHVEGLLQMNQEQLAEYFSFLNDLGYRDVYRIIEENDDLKRRELILDYKIKWAPLIEHFDPRSVYPTADVWKGYSAWAINRSTK